MQQRRHKEGHPERDSHCKGSGVEKKLHIAGNPRVSENGANEGRSGGGKDNIMDHCLGSIFYSRRNKKSLVVQARSQHGYHHHRHCTGKTRQQCELLSVGLR